MSLKSFHILFISISTILVAGFGIWCLTRPEDQLFVGERTLGIGSLLAAVVLVGYGIWFLRKIRAWEDDAAKRNQPLAFRGGDRGEPGAR